MGTWRCSRIRRIAAAFALAGIAVYTLLLPGHITSQLFAGLDRAFLAELSASICHSGSQTGEAPAGPADPATTCPFCKGAAAFNVAFAPPPAIEVAAPDRVAQYATPVADRTVAREAIAPRSRGPPISTV